MIITSCGDGCFKIQTGSVTLMTEPFEGELSARFKPDILLKSRYRLSEYGVKQPFFVVEGAGEYEVKGVEVFGFAKNVYLVKAEDLKLGFLNPAFKESDLAETNKLESVDILFTPVSAETEKIIKQLEPKIVVPASKDWQSLAKAFAQKPEPQEKLTIKKKDIPENGIQVIILTN